MSNSTQRIGTLGLYRERTSFLEQHKDAATISSGDSKFSIKVGCEQPGPSALAPERYLQWGLTGDGLGDGGRCVLDRSKYATQRAQVNVLSKEFELLWQYDGIGQLRSADNAFFEFDLNTMRTT